MGADSEVSLEIERVRGRYLKSDATRARILDRSQDLFVAQGFTAVSLRDVANAAGLSHPAVRRYFDSKDHILVAVVERLEARNHEWLMGLNRRLDPAERLVALAAHNQATPGYSRLFSALAGEATAASHPAHDRFRARYRAVRKAMSDDLDWDVEAAALLAAVSDGLQLSQLYDERVDVASEYRDYLAWAIRSLPDRPGPLPVPRPRGEPAASSATRDVILAAALQHFGQMGFHAARIEAIARSAGVTRSTLLHHFSSKVELLTEVLALEDSRMHTRFSRRDQGPNDRMTLLIAYIHELQSQGASTLTRAYVTLKAEASAEKHPAQTWFLDRQQSILRILAQDVLLLHGKGESPISADQAARWILAAWDGLQIQMLYERDLDVAGAMHRLIMGIAPI